jgi:hypothetical protein
MTRYQGGAREPWGLDVYPRPLDGDYRSLGVDVASRFIDDILGFGCSGPMCYGVWGDGGAGQPPLPARHAGAGHRARGTALAGAARGGDFYVVEVLERA